MTNIIAVGMEVNANHLQAGHAWLCNGGLQTSAFGKTSHVWDIRISDDKGKLVCISRLTVAI